MASWNHDKLVSFHKLLYFKSSWEDQFKSQQFTVQSNQWLRLLQVLAK